MEIEDELAVMLERLREGPVNDLNGDHLRVLYIALLEILDRLYALERGVTDGSY